MTTAVVVLAAGQGTRFRSDLAKVLHPVAGRTMLRWVLEAVRTSGCERVVVVVGHQADAVAAAAADARLDDLVVVTQEPQLGTGHAVKTAARAGALDGVDDVVVLPGDAPLIDGPTIRALAAARGDLAAALLSTRAPDPRGYGRIVRDPADRLLRIVEEADASARERTIDEINAGMYCFERDALVRALDRLQPDNQQHEEYLTDVVAPLTAEGVRVLTVDPELVRGVNDRAQLAAAGATLRARLLDQLMRDGVTVIDPATTYLGPEVQVEAGATLHPATHLEGQTVVAAGAAVGPNCRLVDTRVENDATVTYSVLIGASVGPRATVGPFAYLRPGTRLESRSKAGSFVELKNSSLGERSKVPHLSYVGDTIIGRDANIGAATVTVNYDGFAKHATVIGDGARIGSDTMLVAPVTIGAEAYTGAGSVITQDVPDGALAVERSEQRTVPGYAARRRARHERQQEQ